MTQTKKIGINDRNDQTIVDFLKQYSKDENPIEVNFRNLVPELKSPDRYTHLIHTYPAKLLAHIPYFFLNNTFFSKNDDYVLDPFCGSGTVLLETLLSGRNAYGADANPLARLIAQVKVTKLIPHDLKNNCNEIVAEAKLLNGVDVPNIGNRDFWFPKRTTKILARLLYAIKKIEDEQIRNFMLVSFSNCIKKVSYADQAISVPVKLNPSRYKEFDKKRDKTIKRLSELEEMDVIGKFSSITSLNIERFTEFGKVAIAKNSANIVSTDARKLSKEINGSSLLEDNSVSLIITSPPYAGAQKYIRASSLNLGWTDLAKPEELVSLDSKIIGRENFRKSEITISKTGIEPADIMIERIYKLNPVRATIVCNYLFEMKEALNEMIRVLKKNGFLVLVVGNNRVCGEEFNTQEYLCDFLLNKGLNLQFKLIDNIKSYGLMTKRNKTADIISREWILVFKK